MKSCHSRDELIPAFVDADDYWLDCSQARSDVTTLLLPLSLSLDTFSCHFRALAANGLARLNTGT